MARRTAPPPARPPSSPTRCAPFRLAAAARTDPQAPLLATAQAQGIDRQIDASARCECPSGVPAPSKLRYRLLNDAPTDTNAAYKTPIAVNLPVFPYRRVAQIHAPNQIRLVASRKYPRLALHAQNSPRSDLTP